MVALEDWVPEDALIPWEGAVSAVGSAFGLNVQDDPFGAVEGGVADATAAFQAAALAVPGDTLFVPAGTYLITDEVVYAGLRSNIVGAGKQATIINFVPTAHDKSPFRFSAGVVVDYQCSIRNLTIASSDTTFRKKAIRLDDVSEFVAEDIAIYPFHDASNSSVGIEIRGREWIQLIRPSINADQPVWIKHNPNMGAGGDEDADIVKFEDCGFLPHSSRYSVLVDGDARPSNFLWTGSNDSNGGLGAFYWNNTSYTGVGYSFKVDGLLRVEGASGGWLIYFNSGAVFYRTFVLDGVSGGSGATENGFFLRTAMNASFRNCSYTGTGVGRDIDDTLQVVFENCLWLGGSTQNMNGLTPILQIERSFDATNPGWTYEWWTDPAINTNFASGQKIRLLGVYKDTLQGEILSSATMDLPDFGGAFNRALVQIHADGATQHEFIYGSYDRSGAYAIGSANTGVGNLASKLCIHWTSTSSIVIRNNLGEDVNVVCEISLI